MWGFRPGLLWIRSSCRGMYSAELCRHDSRTDRLPNKDTEGGRSLITSQSRTYGKLVAFRRLAVGALPAARVYSGALSMNFVPLIDCGRDRKRSRRRSRDGRLDQPLPEACITTAWHCCMLSWLGGDAENETERKLMAISAPRPCIVP